MSSHGEEKTEFEDKSEELEVKLTELSKMISESKGSIMFFTGAGISTDADIPDLRGDEGLERKPVPLVVIGLREKEFDFKMPTFSHVAITELIKQDIATFICTSNHDGLHQKGGCPTNKIADLFGNVYVEKCTKCRKLWRREVVVPSLARVCDDENCQGRLQKTGTRMNAMTPQEPLQKSSEKAAEAELAIVLGSSMSVSPFCELPFYAKKVVLVTLQRTGYDNHEKTALTIHARCDTVMRSVMKDLAIEISEFVYQQAFKIKCTLEDTKCLISVTGNRPNENPTCIEDMKVSDGTAVRFLQENKFKCFEVELEGVESGTTLNFTIEIKEGFAEETMNVQITLEDYETEKVVEYLKVVHYNS